MNILVTDGISEEGAMILKDAGHALRIQSMNPGELIAAIGGYDCIIIRSATKVTREVIDAGDRLKVIAHLSEPIDRFDIEDAPLLQQFLESEMSYGLDVATDGVVVTAILAAATDAGSTVDLAAIRGAITTLEEADLEPNAIVLSPSDWADVEAEALVAFAANSNLGPNDAFQRRLYGISVTVTTSIATGKAIIGDFGSALLYVDDKGVRIDVSSATPRTIDAATVSDFELNQLVFRAEKRAAVAVTRPTAFVKLEP